MTLSGYCLNIPSIHIDVHAIGAHLLLYDLMRSDEETMNAWFKYGIIAYHEILQNQK